MAKRHTLDGVQLHGGESPEVCGELKSAGLEVIKVFAVDADFDFASTEHFESRADYFLFDTKASNYGGTGKTFDWSMLDRYSSSKPFFLSGA